jgi:hypothetical protein
MRNCSTVAPQSLLLMNDNFILDAAHALATRLRNEAPGDARGQIVKAWRILYGQPPKENDVLRSLAYLAEQTEAVRAYDQTIKPAKDAPPPDPQLDALASLCQVLYSSNRFLYVE